MCTEEGMALPVRHALSTFAGSFVTSAMCEDPRQKVRSASAKGCSGESTSREGVGDARVLSTE